MKSVGFRVVILSVMISVLAKLGSDNGVFDGSQCAKLESVVGIGV